jgi:cytochrome c551/c552
MANNYTKTMRDALNEAREYRDVQEDKGFSSAQIKMAYGVLNDPRYKQGNYDGAVKAIEKIAKGLSDHPDVKNALKRANEELLDLPATGDTTTSNASQEVEQVDEARFSQSQIDQLKKAYTPLSAKATDMHVSKLKNKMKSYSISHLRQLSTSGIPMVSDAAKELLARDKRFAEETELDEATRLRPTKGLFTLAQMKQQVARTEKAFNEFEQHCNFIFQMDRDVGPAFSDNSGKYFEVHRALDDANKQIKKALADAKKIT